MLIKKVLLSKSYTGFYFDDQKAIKMGAYNDGFFYLGEPVTPGFSKIRQTGEAISIQIILEDGSIGVGDCCAVQYSGASGRDPLFNSIEMIKFLNEEVVPLILKEDVVDFKRLAYKYDNLVIKGKKLHTALRYGLTQAFLSVVANMKKITMAEVVRMEYNINSKVYNDIKVFTQSGDDRYINIDKMIIKEVDVLPHALINNVELKLGKNGEKLIEYIKWLKNRIISKRVDNSYQPILHIDVYGTIGVAFNNNINKITDYLIELEQISNPFTLRIEGPVDTGDFLGTMNALKEICIKLKERNSSVEIVADEWCNTLEDIKIFADNFAGHMLQIKTPDLGGVNNIIEAIIYCNEKNVASYCGGTCNETNISAQTTTHIALACSAKQCLAKPGMGVDEGYMIVKNEMNRALAILNNK